MKMTNEKSFATKRIIETREVEGSFEVNKLLKKFDEKTGYPGYKWEIQDIQGGQRISDLKPGIPPNISPYFVAVLLKIEQTDELEKARKNFRELQEELSKNNLFLWVFDDNKWGISDKEFPANRYSDHIYRCYIAKKIITYSAEEILPPLLGNGKVFFGEPENVRRKILDAKKLLKR